MCSVPTDSRCRRTRPGDRARTASASWITTTRPTTLPLQLDGLAFHPAENRDRERYQDNETIIAVNAKTLRYGFRQVANHPCDLAAQFARALVKNGWMPAP